MGFGSFLSCWRKSKSQLKPQTAKGSSSAQPESYVMEVEEDVQSQLKLPMADSSSSTQRESSVRELEEVFRRFDVNADGKITWEELGWIMTSLGQQVMGEELQRMVMQVDSDGDGCISLDEFIELNTKGVDSGVAVEDIRSAFSLFDANKDGFISCEELHTFLEKLGDSTTLDDCRRMIGGVDVDGDGSINFEEFKLMMMGRSSRLSA